MRSTRSISAEEQALIEEYGALMARAFPPPAGCRIIPLLDQEKFDKRPTVITTKNVHEYVVWTVELLN